ncbi:MAG: glycosyltransferase [Saprospiraceae bacterium]|nr:glycosyltransferase [Saprospiraceae bacterium]
MILTFGITASAVGYFVLTIYIMALIYITFFCLMQFHLLWKYQKQKGVPGIKVHPDFDQGQDLPFVTIQLPIYNERYVVERLIDCIAAFKYPKHRFEIHLLDDSTDDTKEITLKKVEEYKARGFNIEQFTREDRTGYKAGALRDGMKYAKGEFIAIFDADFLPNPEFLLETIPYFSNPKVGVVQTKWEHINQDYSLITKLQAFQLNVHFTVEQTGREAGNYLLQFNGTGGIWRRETIDDAGGWEADTLTEDLDLSYRAQLKGWEIKYLQEIGSPAELPAEMNGLKSQQFRWMKGGAETAKKMLPTVWKSDLALAKKIHATLHLLSSTIFVFVFLVGVFSVPVMFLLKPLGINADYFGIFLIGLLTIGAVYYVGNNDSDWKGQSKLKAILKFVFLFPIFLSLSMGLSLHNTIAVLQGYMGKKSPFVRTPKFDITGLSDSFKRRHYIARKIPFTTIIEGLLALYFLFAIVLSILYADTSFILFHFLLMVGYGSICFYSLRHVSLK